MKRALFPAVFLLAASLASTCGAEGIGSLIEASKGMDDAKKELEAETAGYNRVKSALDSGTIQKGQKKQAILDQYGQPVVMNEDSVIRRERWVYKPASSSFFEGARITLFFDRNGALDEIRESR